MPAGTESGVSLGSRIVLSNFLLPPCSHFQVGLPQLFTEVLCRISARFCESFLDTLKLDV